MQTHLDCELVKFSLAPQTYPTSPSTVSSIGSTWIRFPYLTSGQGWIHTTSDRRTLRLFLTILFMRIFSSGQLSSASTIQTVSFLRFPLRRTVSPRNNLSSSILSCERATTELSSFVASSTRSLLGRSLRRRIAVAKSSGLDRNKSNYRMWKLDEQRCLTIGAKGYLEILLFHHDDMYKIFVLVVKKMPASGYSGRDSHTSFLRP